MEQEQSQNQSQDQCRVKVALYLRRSVEQSEETRNNPDESDSITNQRNLLVREALRKGFQKEQICEYVDDGHTGTNFDRPAFQRLLKDVDAGRIGVVMVKDFSRMGRDYIGVGEYVEQYFPKRGVRIISLNDGWDSNEHVGETMELDTAFRTMIYDMYSKDLSVKRRTANLARSRSGIFIGGFVPYGYRKTPGDTHSIFIDEKAASVVRRIYHLYLEGESTQRIARILTSEGVPTPAQLKIEDYNLQGMYHDNSIWVDNEINRILHDETYTGTLLLNRFSAKAIGSHGYYINPLDQWMKYPGNHEAIIPRELFDAVQNKHRKSKKGMKISKEKHWIPLYCGHCGKKMNKTTRNENTFICQYGHTVPFAPCGQMQIRTEGVQKALVKAINAQASVLLNRIRKNRIEPENLQRLQKLLQQLEHEKQSYREERMKLYTAFKAGELSRDQFLQKKQQALKNEEECLGECDSVQKKISVINDAMDRTRVHREQIEAYALMQEYDYDTVNQLISRVDCFNDGHIRITWNFKSEIGRLLAEGDKADQTRDSAGQTEGAREGDILEYPDVGDNKNAADNIDGKAAENAAKQAAVYTSNMTFMSPAEDWSVSRAEALQYCKESLHLSEDKIRVFHDDRKEEGLFFQEGYMKFIDLGRRNAVDELVINRFSDLYLSHEELGKLLKWIIPEMSCRFISVADHFDSSTATEPDYQQIYKKYACTRRSDLIRYRAEEVRKGTRTPKEIMNPECNHVYGYHVKEDGCYADPETLELVRKIYQKADEMGKAFKVARWLNEQGIPTATAYLNQDGIGIKEKVKRWNGEKVWYVIRNKYYITPCKHKRRCEELGRHCDMKPIIEKELYESVNEKCRYRKDR